VTEKPTLEQMQKELADNTMTRDEVRQAIDMARPSFWYRWSNPHYRPFLARGLVLWGGALAITIALMFFAMEWGAAAPTDILEFGILLAVVILGLLAVAGWAAFWSADQIRWPEDPPPDTKRQSGQAMTEFAFVIVLYMIIILGMVDVGPLLFNVYTAKQMAHRGARAASIYLADGSRTCYNDALAAIGDPWLLNAAWSPSVSWNCTSSPFDTLAPGEEVTVSILVDYTPLFLQSAGPLYFTAYAVDQAR